MTMVLNIHKCVIIFSDLSGVWSQPPCSLKESGVAQCEAGNNTAVTFSHECHHGAESLHVPKSFHVDVKDMSIFTILPKLGIRFKFAIKST